MGKFILTKLCDDIILDKKKIANQSKMHRNFVSLKSSFVNGRAFLWLSKHQYMYS